MWLWRPRVRISSLTPLPFVGVSPSGKARDFDFRTRRSESCHPCQRGALGCRQAVRHRTLTPAFRRFESYHPSQFYDPLAQPAEHLTFNQGVPRSNRGWITIVRGCGGMADAPALGAGTFGVGVQVPSSAPFLPIPPLLRKWLSGRALPCQGKCREFESRLPLHLWTISAVGRATDS